MDTRVLVTGPVSEKVVKKLQDQGFELDVRALKDLVDGDELIKALKGKHAHIYGGYENMDAKAINSADCLKVIAFVGAGYENFVDVNAATRRGIHVTNTPGANVESVAEMTIGLLLSCVRHIPYLNETVRQGKWNTSLEGSEIRGKVLGIIGMGNIGKRVAEIAYYGFGMKIVYYSRTVKKEINEKLAAEYLPLRDLLKVSDVVSIHVPYNPKLPETADMLSWNELGLMKRNAVLINTSRPEIVNGKALYESLVGRSISAAAFDGYYTEPNPPTKGTDQYGLVSLPSEVFVVTPHNAWNTPEAAENMYMMAADSVIDILNGRSNINVVNNKK